MSNYIEHKDKIAFHPGYYIKEIIDERGLTQEDFAKRLATTPKNISMLVRGEQSLSIDIAMKLSRMLGTSVEYWLNLQKQYDALIAEFESDKLLQEERKAYKAIDYNYFVKYFGLPELKRNVEKQIEKVRAFTQVASLTVFADKDMAVSFRSSAQEITEINTIRANIMVQIAINKTLQTDAPKYNKKKFAKAAGYALTLTRDHENFYPKVYDAFIDAGVVFVILPNMRGSKINGATKKVDSKVMLMVNDRMSNADSFWFTLFHEIGHIMNGDFGISFESEKGEKEEIANRYAEDSLIPPDDYETFVEKGNFGRKAVEEFAEEIDRDPGIICGRLQNDGYVEYGDTELKQLKHKYKIVKTIRQ